MSSDRPFDDSAEMPTEADHLPQQVTRLHLEVERGITEYDFVKVREACAVFLARGKHIFLINRVWPY